MEANRRVSVPPGMTVDGVAIADEAGAVETEMNCRFVGRRSVTSRFVTVCPAATLTVSV